MKCENSDCKSNGFFAHPGFPSERYCVSHKTDDMVNIRSFGTRVVRSTIILDDVSSMGLRTQALPSVPPSRVPKVKAPKTPKVKAPKVIKTPVRTNRNMKVPGAPVKVKVARAPRISRIPAFPSLDEFVISEEQIAEFQPMMGIYSEIARYDAPDWKVMARRFPLIAYCK